MSKKQPNLCLQNTASQNLSEPAVIPAWRSGAKTSQRQRLHRPGISCCSGALVPQISVSGRKELGEGGAGNSPELADDRFLFRPTLAQACCLGRPDFLPPHAELMWTQLPASEGGGGRNSLPELAGDLFLIGLALARPCSLGRPGVFLFRFLLGPPVSRLASLGGWHR